MTAKETFAMLRTNARLAFVLLLTALWLLFLLQNIEQVQVSFLFWSFSTPRVLLLLTTFFVGIIVGLLIRLGKGTKKETCLEPKGRQP